MTEAVGSDSWEREGRGERKVKLNEPPPPHTPAFIWSRKDLLWTKRNEGAWPSLSNWSLSTLSLSTLEGTQALAS